MSVDGKAVFSTFVAARRGDSPVELNAYFTLSEACHVFLPLVQIHQTHGEVVSTTTQFSNERIYHVKRHCDLLPSYRITCHDEIPSMLK